MFPTRLDAKMHHSSPAELKCCLGCWFPPAVLPCICHYSLSFPKDTQQKVPARGAPNLFKICVCEKSYRKPCLCTQNQKTGGFTHVAIFYKQSSIHLNYLVIFAQHFESEKYVQGHRKHICLIAFLFQTRSDTVELRAVGLLSAGAEEAASSAGVFCQSPGAAGLTEVLMAVQNDG